MGDESKCQHSTLHGKEGKEGGNLSASKNPSCGAFQPGFKGFPLLTSIRTTTRVVSPDMMTTAAKKARKKTPPSWKKKFNFVRVEESGEERLSRLRCRRGFPIRKRDDISKSEFLFTRKVVYLCPGPDYEHDGV